MKYFQAKYFNLFFASNHYGPKIRYLFMKPFIPYIILSFMEPSAILIFLFTLNKAHYFIWIYHLTYYKIYVDFSWVDMYYHVVFTSGSNIYIYTYHPYRLYMNQSLFNKSYRCLIWTTWVKSMVNKPLYVFAIQY